MAASRSPRPADTLLRHSLHTTTAVHGIGLPVRLRLLALVIALVIAVVSAVFAPAASDDADRGDTPPSRSFGRHLPLAPFIQDAE